MIARFPEHSIVTNPRRFILGLLFVITAVAAPGQGAPTNSVVRFRISHGATFFGDIDVELFDADKPVTVSNFLFYAQSGAYNNSILHRLNQGYVLQGGISTIANPYSSSLAEAVTDIVTGPAITNELNAGPFHSNLFGTIAMARVPEEVDSATSSWFFNLADNLAHDTETNGYAVFGRVIAGTNILKRFNADPSRDFDIIDTDVYRRFLDCPPITELADDVEVSFEFLPIARTRLPCTRYQDLFVVQVLMVRGPDLVRPATIVTFPPSHLVISNDTITVTGTARDTGGVAYVQVFLGNLNLPVIAEGTNDWFAVLTNIPPGTNVITVVSTDASGTKSAPVTRTIFRSFRLPLSLEIDGAGTVLGPTNGAMLELTRSYTLVAKPDPTNLFVGWSGSVNALGSTLRFVMESNTANTAITAVFATNLFPNVKGTYSGLFYDTNLFAQASSGFVRLTVGSSGAYSGKVLMEGRGYPMAGRFDPYGQVFLAEVRRPRTNSLLLYLQVDMMGGSDQLGGLITTNSTFDPATNGTWLAEIIADRAVFSSKLNPTLLAGKYTTLLPVGSNSSTVTIGDGFGRVTVSSAGKISLSGTLADGTKLTLSSPLSREGIWPFYLPLYAGKGSLLGWVSFDTNLPTTDFGGALSWFKQRMPTARYYAGGLSNTLQCLGSRFVPPTTNQVIVLTNATLGFTNGDLAADFSLPVDLTADNKVVDTNSQRVLTITKTTGLFAGSLKPPGLTTALPFKGAVLQKQNVAAGFFLGTNESGRVSLGD